ncbi:7919_t:CDS:2, partial [Scutellospora calospora]
MATRFREFSTTSRTLLDVSYSSDSATSPVTTIRGTKEPGALLVNVKEHNGIEAQAEQPTPVELRCSPLVMVTARRITVEVFVKVNNETCWTRGRRKTEDGRL